MSKNSKCLASGRLGVIIAEGAGTPDARAGVICCRQCAHRYRGGEWGYSAVLAAEGVRCKLRRPRNPGRFIQEESPPRSHGARIRVRACGRAQGDAFRSECGLPFRESLQVGYQTGSMKEPKPIDRPTGVSTFEDAVHAT